MPLSILVPMILIGLPLVVGLVWWMNKSSETAALDEAVVRDRFALDFPNIKIEAVVLSDDGRNAFLKLCDQSAIGLLHKVGQNFLTRLIEASSIKGFKVLDDGVAIRLRDFTLNTVMFKDQNGEAQKLISPMLDPEPGKENG